MLSDPSDLDERSVCREIDALAAQLATQYGSQLTGDMRAELDEYAGACGERVLWAQRPAVPHGEQCLSACYGCAHACAWLALGAAWAAIAYFIVLPQSQTSAIVFAVVYGVFLVAALFDALFRQSRWANSYYALTEAHVIYAHSAYGCTCRCVGHAATVKRISLIELQLQPDAIYVDGYYHLKLWRQYPVALTTRA